MTLLLEHGQPEPGTPASRTSRTVAGTICGPIGVVLDRIMRNTRISRSISVLLAVLSLSVAATACGGSSEASGVQGEAAELTIADLKADGIEVDEGCVHDAAKKLSDDDANAILNNTPLSSEGEEIGLQMFLTCTNIGE